MKRVLVVSSSGSIRGPMITGWLKYYCGSDSEIYCAAHTPSALNTYAGEVMTDAVIDLSGLKIYKIAELPAPGFDFIIEASGLPMHKDLRKGDAVVMVVEFRDLSDLKENSETEILKLFIGLRDEIEDYCFDFVNENVRQLIPDDLLNYGRELPDG